jgi:hypothetical protein
VLLISAGSFKFLLNRYSSDLSWVQTGAWATDSAWEGHLATDGSIDYRRSGLKYTTF